LVYFKKKFPSSIKLFLFIPELETNTNDSRKKLPEYYSTEDVIFNMSRICTWLEFLNSGNAHLLPLSVADRIHTPYRINKVPLLKEISEILFNNNIWFTLSGSGPTLLLFEREEKSDQFIEYFTQITGKCLNNHGIKYRLLPINPCENGTIIIKEME
jgi:homoserine kinase